MKKVVLSNNTISMIFVPIGLVIYLFGFLGVINNTIAFSPFFILLIIGYLAMRILSRNLPGASQYNLFGVVEIHIENTAKGSVTVFQKCALETVLVAKEKNKDVIFTTYHFSKKTIRRIFEEAVTIKETNIFDKAIIIISRKLPSRYKISKKRRKKEIFNGYIETVKLSEDKVKEIKSRIAKLTKELDN